MSVKFQSRLSLLLEIRFGQLVTNVAIEFGSVTYMCTSIKPLINSSLSLEHLDQIKLYVCYAIGILF